MKKKHGGRICFYMIAAACIVLLLWKGCGEKTEDKGFFGKNAAEDKEGDGIRIPEIQLFQNAWIMERKENSLVFFAEGTRQERTLSDTLLEKEPYPDNSVADILLTDGRVSRICVKKEIIHGAVHSWNEDAVTVEGYGAVALAKEYKGYFIFGMPRMGSVKDLAVGYDFADFVLEEGNICAILFTREEPMKDIRVLLKTSGFESIFHKSISLCGPQGMQIQYQEGADWKTEEIAGGEMVLIDEGSRYLAGEERRMRIVPDSLSGLITVAGLERGTGAPSYPGELEITRRPEGLILLNILSLEEYLTYVVPSEMPASYAMEALKAQAVCARTYAYGRMLQAGYPQYGAHLDDSVQYQVYHNQERQEKTTDAVRETYGMILWTKEGTPAETYYYSTSCGHGTDEGIWGGREEGTGYLKGKKICRAAMSAKKISEEGNDKQLAEGEALDDRADFLLEEDPDDYEVDLPWYRWTYEVKKIDPEIFWERVWKNTGTTGERLDDYPRILGLAVTERGSGGVAAELEIRTDQGSYHVYGEYRIRECLCDGETKVFQKNGNGVVCKSLLPSGFFVLEASQKKENVIGYVVKGGGYGHGVGMSQNGARKMAEDGYTAEEILAFFYEGCVTGSIYEEAEKVSILQD